MMKYYTSVQKNVVTVLVLTDKYTPNTLVGQEGIKADEREELFQGRRMPRLLSSLKARRNKEKTCHRCGGVGKEKRD